MFVETVGAGDDIHLVVVREETVFEFAEFLTIARGVEVFHLTFFVHAGHNIIIIFFALRVGIGVVEIAGEEGFPSFFVQFAGVGDGLAFDHDRFVRIIFFVVGRVREFREGAAVVVAGEIFQLGQEIHHIVAAFGVAFGSPKVWESDEDHHED